MMLQITTILHPTDFSPRSEHAFHLACSLAKENGARLIVLHVAEPPVVAPDSAMMVPPLPGGPLEALTDKLHSIQPPDPRIRIEYLLEKGNAADEILRVAQETRSELIVLGTHGRTGLSRLLMGSVAEQVIRKATCSVLVVKAPAAGNSAV
jgi:universal stress protein A